MLFWVPTLSFEKPGASILISWPTLRRPWGSWEYKEGQFWGPGFGFSHFDLDFCFSFSELFGFLGSTERGVFLFISLFLVLKTLGLNLHDWDSKTKHLALVREVL